MHGTTEDAGFSDLSTDMIRPDKNSSGPWTEDQSDIFSSSRSPSPVLGHASTNISSVTEPSDIARLRSLHSTAGYREGIAASKAHYVQDGFDEGYSLGAVVGKKVGLILGILSELASSGLLEDKSIAKEGVVKSLKEAQQDLTVEKVLGSEYWSWEAVGEDEDPWKFKVETGDGKEEDWEAVVNAHPLVQRWTSTTYNVLRDTRIDIDISKYFASQASVTPEKG